MTSSDIVAFFATLISVLALIVAFLNYRRDRDKSNQDFIFQEKVTAYKDLMYHANNIFESFFTIIDEIVDYDGTKKDWTKYFDKECEHYDDQIKDFYNTIFKSIPVIPSNIYKELINFGLETRSFVDSAFKRDTDLTIKAHKNLETSLRKIIKLVRQDLTVDQLNVNLSKRLK